MLTGINSPVYLSREFNCCMLRVLSALAPTPCCCSSAFSRSFFVVFWDAIVSSAAAERRNKSRTAYSCRTRTMLCHLPQSPNSQILSVTTPLILLLITFIWLQSSRLEVGRTLLSVLHSVCGGLTLAGCPPSCSMESKCK